MVEEEIGERCSRYAATTTENVSYEENVKNIDKKRSGGVKAHQIATRIFSSLLTFISQRVKELNWTGDSTLSNAPLKYAICTHIRN